MATELKHLIYPNSQMCSDLNSINVQSQVEYEYLKATAEAGEGGAIVTANTITPCCQEQNIT